MAEPLKNIFFTRASLEHLAGEVQRVHPIFDRERFLSLIFDDGWEERALKDRMHHTACCLRATLPEAYSAALAILYPVAPHITGFDVMTFPDFVEIYGQEEWDLSMDALGYFTQFASGEFAVRPFLDRDPERAMVWVHRWARDPNPNVRRLASEGCRPRLPWAMALPKFKQDPAPILPILGLLKDDESEMVRRSVANNLNDISKDHPELVLTLAEAWHGQSSEVDAVLKHALRGLLKAGDPRAMALFGFEHPAEVRASNLRIEPVTPRIGEGFSFSFGLEVGGEEDVRVRLEYRIAFVKSRGGLSSKVFQISEREWTPGRHTILRRHALVDMTTRTHYPGRHTLTVVVNGQEQTGAPFEVLPVE